jgi:hypothetical protein
MAHRSPTSDIAWATGQYWSYRLAMTGSIARELARAKS